MGGTDMLQSGLVIIYHHFLTRRKNMKKKLLTFLLMLGLMVMIIPYSADAAGGSSIDNAQAIPFGTTEYSGTLTSGGSYFKVTMKKAGMLTLTIDTKANGYLSVYMSDQSTYDIDSLSADNQKIYKINLLSGTYYVKLHGYNGGTFKLKASAKYADQTNPETSKSRDNSQGTAYTIKANQLIKGHLGYNDTVDYFKISVSKKSVLRFETCITAGSSTYFTVENSSEKNFRTIYASTKKASRYVTLAKGTYYIIAHGSKSANANYNGTYSFKLSVTPVGWNKDSKGWWYMNEDGTYMVGGKKKIGSKYYFFSKGGYMQTGWKQISDDWYYFKPSGEMATGWAQISKKWYYFSPSSGYMMTGYRLIGNSYYYLASDGHMMTGWTKVYGYQHYFNSDGTEAHGWKKIGGYWYYMNGSGAMVTGRQMIDGKWYYFDNSGAMI